MIKKLLPLGIKNQVVTELPILIALEAIGTPWFCEAHRSDLRALGLVTAMLAEADSAIAIAANALLALLEVPELDADQTRPLAIEVSTWFQRQPNPRVQAAIDKLLAQVHQGRL
jgi:hypothetical protein